MDEEKSAVRSEEEVRDHVAKIIAHIRPYIISDGGDVELVGIEDGVVTVRMLGACAGCSLLNVTLDNGIKNWILEEVPEIKDVVMEQSAFDQNLFY